MLKFKVLLRRFTVRTVFAVLLTSPQISAHADANSASLSVSVIDSSGAVIPGAHLVLRSADTNQEQQAQTGKSGAATFSFLKPSHYRLTISKNGFSDVVVDHISLNVGDERRLRLTLNVGAAVQTVNVDGSGLTINTTDASVSTVIDRKFVENIPLNGRSFQDLISITPGIVTQSPQNSGQGPGYDGDFSVNGQRTESNYYTVDGVTGNVNAGTGGGSAGPASSGSVVASTSLGTTQSLISVDALQEFRVLSSTYSAEYGRSPGGQFSLVTRSGTDTFHGTAFDYLRNNYFDANDWFNNHYGTASGSLRQNDFGGTIGGPFIIPKLYDGTKRSFIFVSYEGLRLTQPKPATIQYVPDSAMRQLAPTALKAILNSFPQQNALDLGTATTPNLAEFIQSYELPSQIDSTSARFDHYLTPRVQLFFRYGDTPSSSASRPTFALSETSINSTTYTLGSTMQLSGSVDDEFRLGHSSSASRTSAKLDGFGGGTPLSLAAAVGLNEGDYSLFELSFPSAGLAQLNVATSANRGSQWNLIDTVGMSRGHHQLKFGVDYRKIASPLTPPPQFLIAGFTNAAAVLHNSASFATLLKRVGATPTINETAAFAQDEWRILPWISLSIGLRWEINPPPNEAHGDLPYVVMGDIANPGSLALAARGTPLWKTNWTSFAPRLGVAWTAHGTPGWETVVRSGGGVFLDTDNELALQSFTGLGFQATRSLGGSPLPLTAAQLNLTPTAVAPPYNSAYLFPRHLQPPYTLQWNVSVEQELGTTQALNLSYVGASGRRLINIQSHSVGSLNPAFASVVFLPNNSASDYQALQLQFQRTVSRGLHALASYTWSHSIDDGSNFQALPTVRGNADFDVRSNFVGGVSWDPPQINANMFVNALLDGWGIDSRISTRTAFPITLNGAFLTDTATGNQYYGNVNLIPGKPIYLYGTRYPGGRALNGGPKASDPAVVVPTAGTGNAPRNFMRGFGANQVNLAVRRDFPLYDRLALQFRAETFNIFNHPNFGYVDPVLGDANFGQATQMLNQSLATMSSQYQQGGPRSMQFALKLTF